MVFDARRLTDSPCTSAYQDAQANTRSHAWLLDVRWRMLRTLALASAVPKAGSGISGTQGTGASISGSGQS